MKDMVYIGLVWLVKDRTLNDGMVNVCTEHHEKTTSGSIGVVIETIKVGCRFSLQNISSRCQKQFSDPTWIFLDGVLENKSAVLCPLELKRTSNPYSHD
jgi:hypothetical protein